MKALLIPIAALAASSAAVAFEAAPQPASAQAEEARIPFVSFRTIRTFHPVGDDIVYLQDRNGDWYRATLTVTCINLGHAIRIGVDTRFGNMLDNTSSFIVDGERCPIHSLVRSEPPPPRRRHRS